MIFYEAHRHIFDNIPTYFIMWVTGWSIAFYVAIKEGKRLKVNPKKIVITFVIALLCATILARIFFFFGPWNNALPWWAVFDLHHDAYVFYGALIGGFIGVIIAAKKIKENVWKILDISALIIGLGMFFGRIGCFFAGCCYGVKTTLPIGMKYIGKDYARFPSQIISSIYNLLIFIFLSGYKLKKKWDGQIFLLFLMIYPTFRFIIEFYRSYSWHLYGLTASQYISIVLFSISLILYIYKSKKIKIKKPTSKQTI